MESVACAQSLPPILAAVDLLRVARKLQEERDALGLTQEQVEERAGVGQSVISRWENWGDPEGDPSARILIKLVENGLGKRLSEFFRELESADSEAIAGEPSPPQIVALEPIRELRAIRAELSALRSAVDQLLKRDVEEETWAKAEAQKARRAARHKRRKKSS